MAKTRRYRGQSKKGSRKQKGGAKGLVGYGYYPTKPGTWPGAASAATWSANERLDTHGMTMSNYIALSPYGIPVGGVSIAKPSRKATRQCGGSKKTRGHKKRKSIMKGGSFFLTDLYNNTMYRLQNAGESVLASLRGTQQPVDPSVLVQPIGKELKIIGNPPVNYAKLKAKAASEVAQL